MNREPDFDASADMRLLELQRNALGLAPPAPTRWESRYGGESAAGIPDDDPVTFEGTSAVLVVEATANPAAAVIPGAVVTLTLSVANEGAQPARDVVVAVPLPANASYRAGSLQIDGRHASEETAQSFFGEGTASNEIAPGNRLTFVWKIGVRLGLEPLVVVPAVRSRNAAVIGARSLRVTRRSARESAFTAEVQRADAALLEAKPLIPVDIPADELPIYELDAEETLIYEAADAALSNAVRHEEPPAAAVPETIAEPPLPEVPAAAPMPEPPREPELPAPMPEPEPEPVPLRETCVLYGAFDRTTLVFFERTFNGSKAPTLLQHCIFASALACTKGANGEDAAALKAHLDAQSQVLHRIALHEKLGKKEPIAEYAGVLVADLGRIAPSPVGPVPSGTPASALLQSELSAPTLAVVHKIAEERERWDFIKARQLTLALQAQRAFTENESAAAAIENALRLYAQLSMTTLQKLFVRIRIDRTTGLLFASEPALDAAARAVLASMGTIIER